MLSNFNVVLLSILTTTVDTLTFPYEAEIFAVPGLSHLTIPSLFTDIICGFDDFQSIDFFRLIGSTTTFNCLDSPLKKEYVSLSK